MKSCGKRFHIEVGKFRFLNELIKVVSPKVMIPVIYTAMLMSATVHLRSLGYCNGRIKEKTHLTLTLHYSLLLCSIWEPGPQSQ